MFRHYRVILREFLISQVTQVFEQQLLVQHSIETYRSVIIFETIVHFIFVIPCIVVLG